MGRSVSTAPDSAETPAGRDKGWHSAEVACCSARTLVWFWLYESDLLYVKNGGNAIFFPKRVFDRLWFPL